MLNGRVNRGTLNLVTNQMPTVFMRTVVIAEKTIAAIAYAGFQAPLPDIPKVASATPTKMPL